MSIAERVYQHFMESAHLKQLCADEFAPMVASAAEAVVASLLTENKILLCGNGGSAADAQHFAAELVGRFERERPGLAAIALTTDTSILTALANDYAYTEIFSKQVNALGRAGDTLIALSTSGNSVNVLRAIEVAQERGLQIIALSGRGGGSIAQLPKAPDYHFCVPHDSTARIQEVHILLLHALCDAIDCYLMGVEG